MVLISQVVNFEISHRHDRDSFHFLGGVRVRGRVTGMLSYQGLVHRLTNLLPGLENCASDALSLVWCLVLHSLIEFVHQFTLGP